MSTFDPATVMRELDGLATENSDIGAKLAQVQRAFEPIEDEYDTFVTDFEVGLWAQHCNGDAKWPSAEMRERLARQAMPPELYGRFTAHKKSIDRMERRLRSIKTSIEAKRSILSALKIEMEAAGHR